MKEGYFLQKESEGEERRFMCSGRFSGEDPAEEGEIEGGRRRACEG